MHNECTQILDCWTTTHDFEPPTFSILKFRGAERWSLKKSGEFFMAIGSLGHGQAVTEDKEIRPLGASSLGWGKDRRCRNRPVDGKSSKWLKNTVIPWMGEITYNITVYSLYSYESEERGGMILQVLTLPTKLFGVFFSPSPIIIRVFLCILCW